MVRTLVTSQGHLGPCGFLLTDNTVGGGVRQQHFLAHHTQYSLVIIIYVIFMNRVLPVQTSQVKHFLLGFGIGLISDVIIEIVFEVLFFFLSVIFGVKFTDNIAIFGPMSVFIKLGIFAVVLTVLQSKLKNKFITIGTACGIIVSVSLVAMIVPQLLK